MNAPGMARSGMAKLMAVWPYQQELSTEELTYGLSGLISDVGGNMSLLLGVSVISLVELTETLLGALHLCLRRRLGRPRARSVAPPPVSAPLGHYTYTPPVKLTALPAAGGVTDNPPPPPQYRSPPESMNGTGMPRVASGGLRPPWTESRPVTALVRGMLDGAGL